MIEKEILEKRIKQHKNQIGLEDEDVIDLINELESEKLIDYNIYERKSNNDLWIEAVTYVNNIGLIFDDEVMINFHNDENKILEFIIEYQEKSDNIKKKIFIE